MNDTILKGYYWNTRENEYNVQVAFDSKTNKNLALHFEDWKKVAEGVDYQNEETIYIFRKIFELRSDFLNLVKELKRKQIILLKEAK